MPWSSAAATISAWRDDRRPSSPTSRPPRLPEQHRRLRQLADGVTTTGVDDIDLWIGGLAEKQMPFGGMLGSTFNFVFETQLETLQNGDRFYYLARTAGLNFLTELENNSFAKLVMLEHRRDAPAGRHLLDAGLHPRGRPDASSSPAWAATATDDPTDGRHRPDPAGDPRQPGHAGRRHQLPALHRRRPRRARRHRPATTRIDRQHRRRHALGRRRQRPHRRRRRQRPHRRRRRRRHHHRHAAATTCIKGDDGNDVIHGGNGLNLIIGGDGKDFIVTGEDVSEDLRRPGQRLHPRLKSNLPTSATKATTGSSSAPRTARPATTSTRSARTRSSATTC